MRWTSDRPQLERGPSRLNSAPQLEKKVRRTRFVLLIERLWLALWLPLGVVGVFLLVSLFGFWHFLSFDFHRGILWGFAAALAASFLPLIRLRRPSNSEALRRLEARSGLQHRPASSYYDTLSGDAPPQVSQWLWAAHRERMTRLFSRLKSGWPHPRIDRWDPFALRTLLVLLLAVGYIANRDEAFDRLKAAFSLKPTPSLSSARLDAWITPPVYTGQPPIMIADGSRHKVDTDETQSNFTVPVNSEVTVRVNHADAEQFSLRIVGDDNQSTDVPPTVSNNSKLVTVSVANAKTSTAEFKQKLNQASAVELLEDGTPVARWNVDIIQDSPPRITLTEMPAEAQRGSLRMKYSVEDDYGVVSAQAMIERADNEDWSADEPRPANGKRLGEAPSVPLSLPRTNTKKGEGQSYRDLTSHFWAGLPATVTLEARDQAGQTGKSEAYEFTLPERSFHNPLARALIEQRKKLVDRPDLKVRVVRALDALTIAPDLFVEDKSIYLGMRTAYWRIKDHSDDASLESAANLLWQIAVHIEDGNLSDAERRLRQAQEDLMKALEQGASDEELKRLMNELRTALNEFLENLRQQAQQNPDFDPNSQMSSDRMVSAQDLERMLKRIEDLARTGAKDAARQMLSELRDLLENARPGNQAGNRQAQEMMQTLDGLSDLISKQQQLLDETYRTQQDPGDGQDGQQNQGQQGQGQQRQGQQGQGQQGQQGQGQQQGQNGPFPGLQQRQGNLQGELKQLLDKLRKLGAQPPEQFDGAGQAMGKAGDALGEENPGQATEQQTLALDKLRQGAKNLAEQMMRGRGQAGRMGRAPHGGGDRDPLGRPLPTQELDDGDSVKVPEEADIQRARQILEELRKRLGERQRPPSELDYIERLIDRF